jgi:hypothetical protein
VFWKVAAIGTVLITLYAMFKDFMFLSAVLGTRGML